MTGHFHPTQSSSFDQPHFVLQNRYEVVGHLGQGGMGSVYIAKDHRLSNRQCVVKKLRDDFFREEDKEKARAFFEREADVLAQLKHPNIVHIVDYFKENEDYYLVMEYVEGKNLHQMLSERGEPFEEEQVLQWASQITEVLQYLHTHEPMYIYRDLKPSNVMIDTKGHVKLVDFGIARPYAEDSDNTHVVSAGYSPPEQYWGQADPRSDIYGLGATMHFLLTGQEPLALQTSVPKKVNPSVSEHTDLIVQRATAQDVWLRYQSAAELKEELDWRQEEPKQRSSVNVLGIVIGVVSFAVAAAGLIAYSTISRNQHDADEKGLKEKNYLQQLKEKDELISRLEKAKTEEERRSLREELKQREASVPSQPVVPPLPSDYSRIPAATKKPPVTGKNSRPMGIAFREQDETQLTDPEGLAPLEDDSQRPGLNLPFLPGGGDSSQ